MTSWVLVVMHRGASWDIPLAPPGPYRIGRSPECEIHIDESRISRQHAVIEVGPGGVEIADLGSQNGTQLVVVEDGAQALDTGRAMARSLPAHQRVQVPAGAMVHVGSAVLVLSERDEAQRVVTPLRERVAEIEPLARYYLARAAERAGRTAPALSEAARDALLRHGWPGNLGELRDVIERALAVCTGEVIEAEHLGLRPPTVAPLPVPPRR
ncbi:MAG TPA: FHA domain-containing protein [Kofleriaceae bacterium]|nr:FHA domain-containing protein [Kofleriaceae bacterium]